jgi:glycosyltransferase involved in cell wall biosynthesis
VTRVLVSFPGLHRVHRGAEVALEAVADGLAAVGDEVTVLGSGPPIPSRRYDYRRLRFVERERFGGWPSAPFFRETASYESLLFNAGVIAGRHRRAADVTLSAGFPWDNLALRAPRVRGDRPPHVFVTENGDWPALVDKGDARAFGCEGLVCTNPLYFERNRDRWRSALIPNGVDVERFTPGPSARDDLGLPVSGPIVLMVSALIPSKRVDAGIRAVAALDDVTLVVAGRGPQEAELAALGIDLLGERYVCRSFDHDQMPALYRSADLLLHLTYLESFGNVYIEAMATGRPVVAHRSVVTEWILSDEGTLLDTDDHDALVAALDEVLRSDAIDAGHSHQIVAERFSWPVIAAQYHDFLAEVVKG